MKCPNCGKELNEGMKFCTQCGTRMQPAPAPAPAPAPEKNAPSEPHIYVDYGPNEPNPEKTGSKIPHIIYAEYGNKPADPGNTGSETPPASETYPLGFDPFSVFEKDGNAGAGKAPEKAGKASKKAGKEKKNNGGNSKLPLIIAGVVLLIAIVLGLLVAFGGKKDKTEGTAVEETAPETEMATEEETRKLPGTVKEGERETGEQKTLGQIETEAEETSSEEEPETEAETEDDGAIRSTSNVMKYTAENRPEKYSYWDYPELSDQSDCDRSEKICAFIDDLTFVTTSSGANEEGNPAQTMAGNGQVIKSIVQNGEETFDENLKKLGIGDCTAFFYYDNPEFSDTVLSNGPVYVCLMEGRYMSEYYFYDDQLIREVTPQKAEFNPETDDVARELYALGCYYRYPWAETAEEPETETEAETETEKPTEKETKKGAEQAEKNGWVKENGRYRYYSNGKYKTNATLKDGGATYYVDGNGYMVTNSWIQLSGVWYYFGGDGALVKNNWVKDGGWYYVGGDGAMAKGWLQIGGSWYYAGGDGKIFTGGWYTVEGQKYYFDGNGRMLTNTTTPDGVYVDGNGHPTEQATEGAGEEDTSDYPKYLSGTFTYDDGECAYSIKFTKEGKFSGYRDYDGETKNFSGKYKCYPEDCTMQLSVTGIFDEYVYYYDAEMLEITDYDIGSVALYK